MPSEFNSYVDLTKTRERIAAFKERHPDLSTNIDDMRSEMLEITGEARKKYSNPEDAVDYQIGQILRLNEEYRLEGREKIYYGRSTRLRPLSNDHESMDRFYKKLDELLLPARIDPELAVMFVNNLLLGDKAKATTLLQPAADSDDPDAQFILSNLVEDTTKKNELLESSAAKGNPFAQNNLAYSLYNGIGVAKNEERARILLHQSAEQGCGTSMYFLGIIAEKDDKELDYIERASRLNCPGASFILSGYYAKGHLVDRDPAKAIQLLTKAAEQEHPQAQYDLGRVFLRGADRNNPDYDNTRDSTKAILFFARSAIKGHKNASDAFDLIDVERRLQNTPLYKSEILEVIDALDCTTLQHKLTSTFSNDLVGDLVEVSLERLSIRDLAEIYKRLTLVRGIDVPNSQPCKRVFGYLAEGIATKIGCSVEINNEHSFTLTLQNRPRETVEINNEHSSTSLQNRPIKTRLSQMTSKIRNTFSGSRNALSNDPLRERLLPKDSEQKKALEENLPSGNPEASEKAGALEELMTWINGSETKIGDDVAPSSATAKFLYARMNRDGNFVVTAISAAKLRRNLRDNTSHVEGISTAFNSSLKEKEEEEETTATVNSDTATTTSPSSTLKNTSQSENRNAQRLVPTQDGRETSALK